MFIFIVLAIVLMFGLIPKKCTQEYDSPLNFVMYQEPGAVYTDQLVNKWVPKKWRSDGDRIPCRIELYEEDKRNNDERNVILYSHGNAENLLSCVQFVRELSTLTKMDTVCWDYSGYGLNTFAKDERTMDGVNRTIHHVYESLIEDGYKLENMIFMGYSLGTGPSTWITSKLCQEEEIKPAGLILFGAYSSILDVVADLSHPKLAEMFEERWNSEKEIPNVTCPILLLHGQSDGMIKVEHSKKLKAANDQAKLVILPNVGHTSFSWNDSIKEIREWLGSNSVN